jgi:hypothetical protein
MPHHPGLALACSSLFILAACGGSSSPGADIAEPPGSFDRLGVKQDMPARWVESADAEGVVREYYEDILAYEGEQLDVAVRAHLLITQDPQVPSRRYELTEFRLNGGNMLSTTKSSGVVTIETVTGDKGPLTVYRLDGGGEPDKSHVFVRFDDDQLHVVDPAKVAQAEPRVIGSLDHAATATGDRVEISDGVDEMLNWKVRLRPGQELVARLDRADTARAWALKAETTGEQLKLEASSEADGFAIFRLRAVEPGWTDLTFDSGLPYTVRVRVQ